MIKELFQHAAMTDGITVRVAVNFLPEQSRPEAGKWFWVYHIRIENGSHERVQLITRHWRITDGAGMVSHVDGEGVVGEKPVLMPGQSHDYVSGCPLDTPHGSMEGFYTFPRKTGRRWKCASRSFRSRRLPPQTEVHSSSSLSSETAKLPIFIFGLRSSHSARISKSRVAG